MFNLQIYYSDQEHLIVSSSDRIYYSDGEDCI